MRAIIAIVGGLLGIAAALVLKVKFGQKDKFRAYFFAGMGVLGIGIFDSEVLEGRAAVVVGLCYMVTWLATGIVFACQSRREWREMTNQKQLTT